MVGYGRDGKALLPLRYVANMFKEQTLKQLKANMQTQRVFPYEIYPGFHTVNEYRRQLADGDHDKGWFADGNGVRSFEGEVYEADENTGMVTMGFRFNDYMQYVDIGVGAGRKAEDVDRAKNVNFKQRYINKWQPRAGKPTVRHPSRAEPPADTSGGLCANVLRRKTRLQNTGNF